MRRIKKRKRLAMTWPNHPLGNESLIESGRADAPSRRVWDIVHRRPASNLATMTG